jgi:hypothetical protein
LCNPLATLLHSMDGFSQNELDFVIGQTGPAARSRVNHQDRDDRRLTGVMGASVRTQDLGHLVEHEFQV